MKKCSKKDMQRQGGLIRPSSVLLTTGLLMMAASPMLAAGGTGLTGQRSEDRVNSTEW